MTQERDRSTENSTRAFAEATTWDTIAANYEELAEPFTRQYAVAALALAGGVQSGERVLDVAAGTGALALAAAKGGAKVLATDFSTGMVARLADRFREQGAEGSEARVMDGQALDLADASFDAAFAMFGVMMFPDWRRGLAELARVVRPGGRGCVGVWAKAEGAGPMPTFHETYRRVFPKKPIPPTPPAMTRLADPAGFRAEMEAAGFRDVVVQTISGVFEAPSAGWMAENMDRIFRFSPLYTDLDAEGKRQISAAIETAWERYETPGGIRIPADAHIAVGHR